MLQKRQALDRPHHPPARGGILQDIVSRADFAAEDDPLYDRVLASYWSRALGLWAIGFAAVAMDWQLQGVAFWRALSLGLAMGVFSGLIFVLLMHFSTSGSIRAQARARLDRVFSGAPAVMPPAPDGATHRLLCGVIVGRGRAAGAALYIVPNGLRLLLHYPRRRRWYQRTAAAVHQEITIEPLADVRVKTGAWRLAWWQHLLARQERPTVLLIEWGGQAVGLRVPLALATCERLEAAIRARLVHHSSGPAAV